MPQAILLIAGRPGIAHLCFSFLFSSSLLCRFLSFLLSLFVLIIFAALKWRTLKSDLVMSLCLTLFLKLLKKKVRVGVALMCERTTYSTQNITPALISCVNWFVISFLAYLFRLKEEEFSFSEGVLKTSNSISSSSLWLQFCTAVKDYLLQWMCVECVFKSVKACERYTF